MSIQHQQPLIADTSPLVDGFGRVHTDLRISVTDRCNIRCFYCMPAENVRFKPRSEILSFEEIDRFVRVVAQLGVHKVRLTGGEPLVRQNLAGLVAKLVSVPGIDDIALTTNGILLAEQAQPLHDAGLPRLNISLDTLDPETFRKISRRDGFERVLEGIFAAQRAGFEKIKLNAVAIRGITEPEIVPLAQFAREHGFELRFIEFMPLDADGGWDNEQVLAGDEIRDMIQRGIGPLEPVEGSDPSQPATDYRFVDGGRDRRFHQSRDAALLRRLQSTAADGRGASPQLPVLDRRNGTRGRCCAPAAATTSWPIWCAPASAPSRPATASTATSS